MTQAIARLRQAKKPKRFQEFVFVSDSAISQTLSSANYLQSIDGAYLAGTEIGEIVEIEQVHAPHDVTRQLESWGFEVGKQIRLLSRTDRGSVIVEGCDISIGVGKEIARRIMVSLVKEKQQ